MSHPKNYQIPSKLENHGEYLKHGEDHRVGLSVDELRERFGMKKKNLKKRKCLKCEMEFETDSDRLCGGCK